MKQWIEQPEKVGIIGSKSRGLVKIALNRKLFGVNY